MVLASKRRVGSGDGVSSVFRSGKSSSVRTKEKHLKFGKDDEEHSSKHGRDREEQKHHCINGGGLRSRFFTRASYDGRPTTAGVSSVDDAPLSSRHKDPDPLALARGMSSRAIGARISSQINPLSAEEIERDIRHMEAYGAACISYAQHFFAFTNQELVARGIYGSAPNAHCISVTGPYLPDLHIQSHCDFESRKKRGMNTLSSVSCIPTIPPNAPVRYVTMPVKICPEEEERLVGLREKISASETKREILETEYMSLRAHYINETQMLRRTRNVIYGQLALLKALVKRRGEMVVLLRVLCAMAEDVLYCLVYRTPNIISRETDVSNKKRKDSQRDSDECIVDSEKREHTNSSDMIEGRIRFDIVDAWAWIYSKIEEAKHACIGIHTPKELISVNKYVCTQTGKDPPLTQAMNDTFPISSSVINQLISRTRFQTKKEDLGNLGLSRKKSRIEKDNIMKDHFGDKVNKSKIMGGNNNEDVFSLEREGHDVSFRRCNALESTLPKNATNKTSSASEDRDIVVPWDCQVMPRTPYDVPVFISPLSTVPDGSVAFGCGDIFGHSSYSLRWLESNLPSSIISAIENMNEKLVRLKNDVSVLSTELEKEIGFNEELQYQAIAGRKRSDEMCAVLNMLRTETEEVLTRHNIIMDTPEAQMLAKEILLKSQVDYLADEDRDAIYDGDMEVHGSLTDEEEEDILEDDDNDEDQTSFSVVDDDRGVSIDEVSDLGEEDVNQEEEETCQQPMREVIVPHMNSDEKSLESNKLKSQAGAFKGEKKQEYETNEYMNNSTNKQLKPIKSFLSFTSSN